jgi:SAM-dependent methyltransferase
MRAVMANLDPETVDGFGYEWSTYDQGRVPAAELERAFAGYFSLFPWSRLPPQAVGFDLGCGSGRWARFVAARVGHLHCIDASPAALEAARRHLGSAPQCELHCASVDALPLAPDSMDFGYSLGVLHHVPDTAAALRACVTRLKPGAPFLLYIYYALENRPLPYRMLFQATNVVRRIVSRLPTTAKRAVAEGIAGGVYFPLARSSRLLERFGLGVQGMPLAYYRNASFATMRTDAFDRFATRLEKRFTRDEIAQLMTDAGLGDIAFREGPPYWCALGYRVL